MGGGEAVAVLAEVDAAVPSPPATLCLGLAVQPVDGGALVVG